MGRWLRRLLIGAGVLLGLPLLLAVVMLGEAHLEMQRVAPPIPERAALEAWHPHLGTLPVPVSVRAGQEARVEIAFDASSYRPPRR